MSDTPRTYREMLEDVAAWRRAGYPAVACGRYQDAAERIRQLERQLCRSRVFVRHDQRCVAQNVSLAALGNGGPPRCTCGLREYLEALP